LTEIIQARLCTATTIEEECELRQKATAIQVQTWRSQLTLLLRQFSKIRDPRNPNKLKHKLTVLLLYGLLCSLYQMSSRRQAKMDG